MSFLDSFKEDMTTQITITGPGAITGYNADGTPIQATVTKYSDYCTMWLSSANEQYNFSLLGYKETHTVILYPEKELNPISPGDTAVVSGRNFIVLPGENILDKEDVLMYKVGLEIRK